MLTLCAATLTVAAAQTPACDRACLTGHLDRYLASLISHDAQSLPLASNVKFTEDTVVMKPGEGLWKTATRIRAYRQDTIDLRQGVAASQVIVEEAGKPAMLMARLKVAGGKITEIETMVVRTQSEGKLFAIETLTAANPAMNVTPPAAQRASRAEAIRLAEYYPAGLKVGSFVEVGAPFAPNAYRIENGVHTAGPGCARGGCENMKTQTIMKHPAITHRVAAVDEEQGIVLIRMNFGDTGSYGPGNALIVWENFKVYNGQIHAVEAFMETMPATAGSGWD